MQVDLKGVIYDAAVVPSYALLVVNIGPNEAKVEAVMNDFVQLHPRELVAEVERQAFEFGDDADSDEDADTRCASPTVLSDVSHARSFVRSFGTRRWRRCRAGEDRWDVYTLPGLLGAKEGYTLGACEGIMMDAIKG